MRRFIVFAPAADVPKALVPLGEAVDIVTVSSLAEVEADGHPSVLILTAELVQDADLGSLPAHVTVLAKGPEARAAADGIDRLFLDMDDLTSQEAQLAAIRSAGRASAAELARAQTSAELEALRGDLQGLNQIGMALMSERDPDVVLELMLTEARRLTTSDGGSLYLVEEDEDGTQKLHFLRSQSDSLPDLEAPDFSLPFDDRSLAGYVALRGEPLSIEDAYPRKASRALAPTWSERIRRLSPGPRGRVRAFAEPGGHLPGGHSRVQRAQGAARSQCRDSQGHRGHNLQ